MSFICGFSGNQDDDLEDMCITPQRKTTRPCFGNKDSKNPYSNHGLDKFEALLADLEGKRQMIYTKKGSEDISFVRFVYSNSNDVKPVVVKVKDRRKQDKDRGKTPAVSLSSPEHRNTCSGDGVVQVAKPSINCKDSNSFYQLRRKFGGWWRPGYSLPLFVMLILVFLVFFGRSVTIFCASIGWYMVPMINGTSEIRKRPKKNTVTSPRSVLRSGPVNTRTSS